MNTDLRALDFDAIQRMLEKLARTPYGEEAARNLMPAPNRVVALQMQAAVSAARQAIDAGEAPRLTTLPQIQAALRQAVAQGAVLRPQALSHIAQVLEAAAGLVADVERRAELYPGPAADLNPAVALRQRLAATVEAHGRLRSDATPRLAELTAEYMERRRAAESIVLERMRRNDVADGIRDPEKVHWQGDRAVLAIPHDLADKVKGVRHGTHVGGRDQLIEPLEVVGANNRTEAMCGEVNAEQQRVLREVTDEVRANLEAINRAVSGLTWIDLAVAAGELSARMGGHAPALTGAPGVVLQEAYHPLLLLQFADGTLERPVPLTLHLDNDRRILVITGPNTGGKTVALKTLGLLIAMAQCGLHVPADGDCTFGWYRNIMVDVGDRQSLYHHLSTFAGHVEVLKRILEESDGHSLVLLDELGTGTDPEEGAALAMAVLDELADRGVQGIVNTHLSPLKEYAASRQWLCNACMLFDQEKLRPTYRLAIGQPGVSLGLIIAESNGLPGGLIERARGHLRAITEDQKAKGERRKAITGTTGSTGTRG